MRYGMQPVLSLGAKMLCTLLNVHKLVSLLRITPTGKSCSWWAFSYCLQTTFAPQSKWTASHIDLTCLRTCTSLTHTTYCVTATSAYACVFFVRVMWNDNGPVGVLPLAEKLHFMNAQWTSFFFPLEIGPRTNILRQYIADESSLLFVAQIGYYTLGLTYLVRCCSTVIEEFLTPQIWPDASKCHSFSLRKQENNIPGWLSPP